MPLRSKEYAEIPDWIYAASRDNPCLEDALEQVFIARSRARKAMRARGGEKNAPPVCVGEMQGAERIYELLREGRYGGETEKQAHVALRKFTVVHQCLRMAAPGATRTDEYAHDPRQRRRGRPRRSRVR